ncbi:hypothetical protein ONS95_003574 [Cadophora gregata]|uniref:uncharacterized protein n=1 Tax=Cadophora gregata TaxID=51156 RepID=UPI0026DB3226|nr:uncharacterized protein ONS95_003574 [Cadophora gregata]KAK0099353.1 hypothetical protein ONS96_008383 [Cadophora gregata f. sp. sojae]KAK0106852.1 hypothetical protein ONS95_003574 [Cadophora gregata]
MDTFLRTPSDDSPGTLRSPSHFGITPQSQISSTSSDVEVPRSDDGSVRKRGRKGHTKSRTGCFNCKRARIKCKENRPSCDYCAHRDLKCEWPEIQINQAGTMIRKASTSSSISTNPSTQLPVFTIQDFRLFNHFIQSAYPSHPIGNDSVWRQEVPSISPDYDFLLHSMLALAAADIAAKQDEPEMKVIGMTHRVQAIESLNKAIDSGIKSFIQGNAMLAACFALLFHSVFISDGLGEYMSFIRGTVAVGMKMGQSRMKFLFEKAFGDEQMELIGPALKLAPLVHTDVSRAACRSLEKFGFLCERGYELMLYGTLLSMARNLVTSSQDAYMELRKYYGLFMMLPQQDFVHFIDPKNIVGKLIQAHFVSMQLIMTPITNSERAPRQLVNPDQEYNDPTRSNPTVGWLSSLHSDIPDHMMEYFQWTLWVEQEVHKGKLYTGVYD